MNKLDAALDYADRGYAVFPCVPNEKRPLTPNGLLDATTDSDQIVAWWQTWPDANVAIVTTNLLVLDFDVDDAGQPNAWLSDQPERLLELAAAPLSLTPRGGKHFVFKCPIGAALRNTANKIAPHVDTRANGGYILVPPSIVGGRHYRWAGDARLDCTIDRLPEPPRWLLDMLTGGSLPAERHEAPQVANKIPPGQRNDALARLGGSMRRIGMSEAEIRTALRRVNLDRCTPPMAESEVDKIAWSVGRYEPDGLAVAYVENHWAQDQGNLPDNRPKDPGAFPMELLELPGYIGDVCRFNVETAMKPQPILALAGALALLAVLTGRKIKDPYGTRTNVYILGVGPTACGKEHARRLNKEILYNAQLMNLVGTEELKSSAGLVTAVQESPAVMLQLDEIGKMLRSMTDARANPHVTEIPAVLMKLFTAASSFYRPGGYRESKNTTVINQPCCVIYGTTVPDSLYQGFTPESIDDGFLSRMLVFETDTDPPHRDIESIPPPQALVDVAKVWGAVTAGGNLASINPEPLCVPYTNAAVGVMNAFREAVQDARDRTEKPYNALWTRAVEKARKLALLYACSESAKAPLIDVPAVQWAGDLVDYLTRRMAFLAEAWIAENKTESTSKRLLRIIAAEPSGISLTQLTRKTRFLTSKERTQHLTELQAARLITEETTVGVGRPGTFYRTVSVV